MKIDPTIHSDNGAIAIVVNSIPKVFKTSPSSVSTKDIPISSVVLKDKRKFIHQ